MKKNSKKPNMQQQALAYIKDEAALLKRHKVSKRLIVSFPDKKHVPLWGKFGMWLVRVSGGKLDTMYTDASGSR